MNATIQVWITKYALTRGVEKRAAALTSQADMIVIGYEYYHKGQWHQTEADARKKAEAMRVKRIASLRQSIAKLERMSFEGGPQA